MRLQGNVVYYIAALSVCCALIFGSQGCGTKKEARMGKFSKEEMDKLPFAERDPSKLPAPSGAIVLAVNNMTITTEEIITPLKPALEPLVKSETLESFRDMTFTRIRAIVNDKVAEILLYQKALGKAPKDMEKRLEKAVEKEEERFIASHGYDRAKAEAALAEQGYDGWKGYRIYTKKFLMIQSYVSSEIDEDVQILHGELLDYYEEHKAERFERTPELQYRLIDIVPAKLSPVQIKSSEGETAADAAFRLANELHKRIQAGEDFGELAKKHSHEPRNIMGGLQRPVVPGSGSLVAPYDILETKAMAMEAGEVSEPIKTREHVFLLKVETKIPGGLIPFEEVQHTLESEIKKLKRKENYDKLITSFFAQADIGDVDLFVESCVKAAYRKFN